MKGVAWVISLMIVGLVFAEGVQFNYDDHGKRDPFWRLVSPGGGIISYETDLSPSEMTLEGIIYDSGGNSLAIINGNIFKANDKFGLSVISKIEEKKVILLKGQESFILELKKEE